MKRRSLDRTLLDAIRTFFWGRIFLILNWISEYHPSNQMLEDLTIMIIVQCNGDGINDARNFSFGVRQDDFLEMEMVMMIRMIIKMFMMITMMIEVMLCVVRQDNPLTRLRLFLLSSLNRWWDGIMIIIIVITITINININKNININIKINIPARPSNSWQFHILILQELQ